MSPPTCLRIRSGTGSDQPGSSQDTSAPPAHKLHGGQNGWNKSGPFERRGLRDRALQQEAIPGVHQMDAHIFFTEAPRLKPSRVVFFDKNVGVLCP